MMRLFFWIALGIAFLWFRRMRKAVARRASVQAEASRRMSSGSLPDLVVPYRVLKIES